MYVTSEKTGYEADSATALRFFDAAHETFQSLLPLPTVGRARPLGNPQIAEIRQWAVAGFGNHLISYRILPTGINVVRVLHGAREIDRLLLEETD